MDIWSFLDPFGFSRTVLDPYRIARPILLRLDPEEAHDAAISALEWNLVPGQPREDDPILAVGLFGKVLRNPVGLAAGFDKNGRVYDRMASHGFGFAEIGSITPKPQAGNCRPRIFRLTEDRAVINRMGFPNEGASAIEQRLAAKGRPKGLSLGINLASNTDSRDPAGDFVELTRRIGPYADYLALDISCPNTNNGQLFLDPSQLSVLLRRIAELRQILSVPPIVAKLSPDLNDDLLERLVETLLAGSIDGIIVSNTTLGQREGLRSKAASETGGLSGAALFESSTKALALVRRLAGPDIVLIGVGGVSSGADAYAKIRAGANVVQLYTALVYEGTGLVTKIKRELAALLKVNSFGSVREAVGGSGSGTVNAPKKGHLDTLSSRSFNAGEQERRVASSAQVDMDVAAHRIA